MAEPAAEAQPQVPRAPEANVVRDIVVDPQYSSQIVETDTVSLEFSGKILRFLLHTVFPTEMCLLPPSTVIHKSTLGKGKPPQVFQDF